MVDTASHRPRPVPGILTFIAADTANFILFFGYFMVERVAQPDLFAQSAKMLDSRLGLLNTAILITSGWLVALAVEAARMGDMSRVRRHLLSAIGIGLLFGIVKTVEYADKISHGLTPQTNAFFGFYYVFTGIHLLHYAIGIALLGATLVKARSSRARPGFLAWIEACGLFWHMVDLLWVFLFAMLYLQGVG
ncbi:MULTISPECIES: cytochrome c oxidase subunit 3 [Sphingobium]|uniref:cytochrome c oxidase subunit 3 n=1 Tax=Sphingobium sp. MI1205 TaxID=407020 RepID=UPI0007706C77|nr:cytochrome c oxidase subunit 3 [Sphingobium sp. MI1205]AMK17071.1 heme/copper-type cytochrome/quinol oxidase, subunit 3 [Sphingobium sp. MI1205]